MRMVLALVAAVLAGAVLGSAVVGGLLALPDGPDGGDRDAPAARDDVPARPLDGRLVVLDPGHQLGNAAHPAEINAQVDVGSHSKACNTTGTSTDSGYAESTFVFEVARLVRARLRAEGARVVLTRSRDDARAWGPCVDVRGRAGNREHADLKLSLHADGAYGGGPGFHVIAPQPLDGLTDDIARDSWAAAMAVRSALRSADLPTASYVGGGRGLVRRDDLGTLNLSDVPTVMVELGNMRDPDDAARMTTASGRRQYAEALAAAVLTHLR
jgi:N-acetylmuramoyl-L-alanine amidase